MEEEFLNKNDIELIKTVIISDGKNWDDERLTDVKSKIKQFHRTIVSNKCCYCCRSFKGEFNMVIDIEHILPKGKFKKFEFTPLNLSLACKRCNMEIKKQNTDFLIEEESIDEDPFNTNRYLIIHPNIDIYKDNLRYSVKIEDDIRLVKYIPVEGMPKGKYTYGYFKLHQLEEDTANEAQGVKEIEFSKLMSDKDVEEIQKLIEDIEKE